MTDEREAVVYFVKAGNAIKIGFTTNLAGRLKALSWAQPEPLTVLGIKLGGRAEEAELHRKLAAHRLNGEWFRDCQEVRAAIGEGLTVEIPPPPTPADTPKLPRERKPFIPRVFSIDLPPSSEWPVLSKRMKQLDDTVGALGIPKEKGRVLHRALTEFTGLFKRYAEDNDDSPELVSRATAIVEQAEREIAA